MRAALYARVSSEEQVEGYSIDAQLRACRDFAQGKGWAIVAEYVDEGKSARAEDVGKRPRFKEMLEAAKAKEFDLLVVHKLDRFSRNLLLTLRCFDELSKSGTTFISLGEQIDYSTPMGRVFLAMSGAFAQFYSDNLSQETKKGWHERRAQGLYCGILPFGVTKGEDGVPVPDPSTHPGLTMAFELAAQGKSDREVAEVLTAKGYRTTGNQGNRPFSKDTVRGILQNRFYLGYLPDGAEGWTKGRHEPMIAEDIFLQVQETRRRNRKAPKNHPGRATLSSLTGLAYCWYCKGRMHTGTTNKGKKRIMCASRAKGNGCHQTSTLLDALDAQIEAYLENFHIPEDYQERIMEAHRKLQAAFDESEKAAADLRARLERNRKLFKWGDISENEYLAEKQLIDHDLQTLAMPANDIKVLEKLAGFLKDAAQAWREADQNHRNALARQLFDEVWIKDKQVVATRPRSELEPFFRLSFEQWRKRFESADSNPLGVASNPPHTLLDSRLPFSQSDLLSSSE